MGKYLIYGSVELSYQLEVEADSAEQAEEIAINTEEVDFSVWQIAPNDAAVSVDEVEELGTCENCGTDFLLARTDKCPNCSHYGKDWQKNLKSK